MRLIFQSSHRPLTPHFILALSFTTTIYTPTCRLFSTLPPLCKTSLPPRPTLPDGDLKHVYLKGSGPGGQKINKTSSAVQLTHLPTGIVVKSQATRSRSQNHTIARRILAEKIELLEKGDESRVAKKIERDRAKKASRTKKAKRKYRRLEEEGQERSEGAVGGAEDEGLDGRAEKPAGVEKEEEEESAAGGQLPPR